MTISTQQNRLMRFTSPLGEDYLLIHRLVAREEMSQLFSFKLELLHDEETPGYVPTAVDETEILGKMVNIEIAQRDGTTRHFNGMVNQFSQGNRNIRFSRYSVQVVPHIWLLTQNFQSRIFQHKSVPEILRTVFEGFLVSYEIQGEFKARNYCVQYRETDFDFASRLMEEEGLFYYFEHTADSHKMIIANSPQSHQDTPSKNVIPFYVQTDRQEDFVSTIRNFWTDTKLQTGTVTLWDNNFQMPMNKLDVQQPTLFTVADNKQLERYDFPAGYARKYDGIDGTGGERPADLQNIFPDKTRTAENMMNALDSGFKVLSGISDCCALTAGHRFTLEDHPADHLNAQYVITGITHSAEQNPQYVSNDVVDQPYTSSFKCIPHGDRAPNFCPPKTIAKPLVYGSQTATVVGPAGEEIFTDKYGRVKVQFHWDREGEVDANSSCWIRVAQGWAGNRWGMMFIPRIGMEVLVNFIDGDPDLPIISGCVYNPAAMPPYQLPDEKTKMAIKSDSSKGGQGFNEIRFEDKKGSEQVFVHGEKDIDIRNKNDRREWIGNDQHYYVHQDRRDQVHRDEHRLIERHQYEKVVEDHHREIGGQSNTKIVGPMSLEVTDDIAIKCTNGAATASSSMAIKGSDVVVEGMTSLTLKVGGNFININSGGIFIKGTMVMINSGGAAGSGNYPSPTAPTEPEEPDKADDAEPGTIIELAKRSAARKEKTHREGNEEKKSWVKIKLVDEEGEPVAGVSFKVETPDGKIASGSTNKDGQGEVKNIDPGNCKITFPNLDKEAWEEA